MRKDSSGKNNRRVFYRDFVDQPYLVAVILTLKSVGGGFREVSSRSFRVSVTVSGRPKAVDQ
jgi:hypothetical protein